MGRFVAEPINPYAPPQCEARPLSPGAVELGQPIVLRGEINLAHEVLVMRRLRGGGATWIIRLFALFSLCAALFAVYRFWLTGDRNLLWAAIVPALGAVFFASVLWIFLGLLFGASALLGIPYQKSFWAQATNEGLRTRGAAGEEFQPWWTFSRMEMSGELIFLYGHGNQRGIPIAILNLHWCTTCADEERLLSLLEARFGPDAPQLSDPVPHREPNRIPAAPHPAIAGEEPLVLAGMVELDQLLRIGRLKQKRHVWEIAGVIVVVFAGAGTAILWRSEPHPEEWAVAALSIGVASLCYAAGLFKPQIDAWRLRRAFVAGQLVPLWTTWTISAGGVSQLTDALETHESWSQLCYRGEAENMLVLTNRAGYHFHFLPREFATDEQWERLRMHVRQAVDRGELTSREIAP